MVGDDCAGDATTDREGRFRIAGLPPGPCALTTDPFEGDLGLDEPMPVLAGNVDVVLRLAAISGTLAGRVEAGGEAWVTALGPGFEMLGRRCDLDGGFRYAGLRVGTWSLVAHDDQGRAAVLGPLQVLPARETGGLSFDLAPGAVLQLRHAAADEFRVLRGDLEAARDNLQPHTAGEARVPAGAWTVVFRQLGHEVARRDVVVLAGETLAVDGTR